MAERQIHEQKGVMKPLKKKEYGMRLIIQAQTIFHSWDKWSNNGSHKLGSIILPDEIR